MSKNSIDYVKEYGDFSFSEVPFNEIDSMILSQLSYLNYEGYVGSPSENKSSTLYKDIYESKEYERIFVGYWYYEDNKAIIDAMVHSKRYGDLKLNYYVDIHNENSDAQFSAVTYKLGDGSIYVAFRGTDATLLGWKEDFKMAYSRPIISQKLALDYLTQVSELFSGSFRVGGHSKGGNLAVYASMMSDEKIRDRLIAVYSHDGPGFRPEILSESHINDIRNRLHKYIPKESIVGIIMNEDNGYDIIESTGIGTFQHNTYTWKCDGCSLVRAKKMSSSKVFSDAALNEWILSLTEEELDHFIDALFDVVSANNVKNLFEIKEHPGKSINQMMSTYKELDKDAKDNLVNLVIRLKDIMEENLMSEVKEAENEIRNGIQKGVDALKTNIETLKDNIEDLKHLVEDIPLKHKDSEK